MFGKKSQENPIAQGTNKPVECKGLTMRAVTWEGKEKVSVTDVPRPLITHPGDVIVKVTACSIAGCDENVTSPHSNEKGTVLGHEACGIVYDIGTAVTKFKQGDRVVIAPNISCGRCTYCKRGEFSACDMTNNSQEKSEELKSIPGAVFGASASLGGVPGSQSEFVRVPLADVNCFRIPDSIPDNKAVFAADTLCTSLHPVDMAEVDEGDTVVIWGLGPIGLYTARWAQTKGAVRVIGVDNVPERLALAKVSFGIEVLDRSNLSSDQVVDQLLSLVPGGVDAVIEAVGYPRPSTTTQKLQHAIGMEGSIYQDLIGEMVKVVRKFGRVVVVGDHQGNSGQVPLSQIMWKHLTLRSGITPCQYYFQTVMEAIEDGRIDPLTMVTHRITLEQAPEAYAKLANREGGYVKVLINPQVAM